MKKVLMLLFMGIFLLSFASATLTYKVNEEVNITQTCLNVGYCSTDAVCNLNVFSPSGLTTIENKNLTNAGSYFYTNITPVEIGRYAVTGNCVDGSLGGEINYNFDVTNNGEENTGTTLWGIIFLAVAFGIILFFIYWSSSNTNYEKWYNKVIEKYRNKNYVKFGLSALGYNIMKNTWVLYYIVGFFVVILIYDVAYVFNISSVFETLKTIVFIYTWGFVLVGLVFLSYIQEWFMDALERATDMDWGMEQ